VRFLVTSTMVGFGIDVLADRAFPATWAPSVLHPPIAYGATAAIAATSVAWSLVNADMQVRLFFFLPVSGKQLLWITVGFCALGLVYPGSVPEGPLAPFGGVLVGVLLGGTPSALRSLYLRGKLGVLRRRTGGSGRGGPFPSRAASSRRGPPLRVVQGGGEDDLKKRRPPKDKRFLN